MARVKSLQIVSQDYAWPELPIKFVFRGLLVTSLLAGLLFFGFSLPAQTQLYAGSVTGTVRDSSGAVIPAAAVTLVDEQRGFSFAAKTDSARRFLFRSVPPSIDKLSVAAAFKDEGTNILDSASISR